MPENRGNPQTGGGETGRSEGGTGRDEGTLREDAGRASTLGGSSNRDNPSEGPGGGATNVRGDHDEPTGGGRPAEK